MKLPELKERLKNSSIVKVVAGVLVLALVGTGVGGAVYTVQADNDRNAAEQASEDTKDLDVEDLVGKVSINTDKVDKEESVYVITDASGTPTKTIVTSHLTNKDGSDTIEDETDLKDIENLKGDETFKQDGNRIVWDAKGKEIYYQGTTDKELPIDQKVTYRLDGEEITPEELAGKSGRVTIRFDYENKAEYTEKVNGEDVTVKTPFAAVTALLLNDSFSNVEVTNGKVRESDDRNIVIGYALPGLEDSLALKKDRITDVNIPDHFEVSADVKDFSLDTAMTFVINAAEFISADGISTSDLDDAMDQLTDASSELKDGSGKLADGTKQLADGAGKLSDGAEKLSGGADQVADGAGKLAGGIDQAADGAEKLSGGADQVAGGADTLAGGLLTLSRKFDAFAEGIESLGDGLNTYLDGASQVNEGIKTLYDGTGSLQTGAKTIHASAKSISDAIAMLDASLHADLTDEQKQAIEAQAAEAAQEAVDESYEAGTQEAVAEKIYQGLRYSADGEDGALYASI